jgi:hypothetical protein
MMRVEKGIMVPLGYGKFFRSESILGLEPIEENRGPGRRTLVYVDNIDHALVASRSENAILRDLSNEPIEELQSREQHQLLVDIVNSIASINPMLRSIIRDQGKWDLDRLEERAREALGESDET